MEPHAGKLASAFVPARPGQSFSACSSCAAANAAVVGRWRAKVEYHSRDFRNMAFSWLAAVYPYNLSKWQVKGSRMTRKCPAHPRAEFDDCRRQTCCPIRNVVRITCLLFGDCVKVCCGKYHGLFASWLLCSNNSSCSTGEHFEECSLACRGPSWTVWRNHAFCRGQRFDAGPAHF